MPRKLSANASWRPPPKRTPPSTPSLSLAAANAATRGSISAAAKPPPSLVESKSTSAMPDIDDEAVLEVSCIFGGVELRVPETWYVHSRSLPVFGGFEDKTRQPKVDPPAGTKRKTLIVTGVVVFGGVEIGN